MTEMSGNMAQQSHTRYVAQLNFSVLEGEALAIVRGEQDVPKNLIAVLRRREAVTWTKRIAYSSIWKNIQLDSKTTPRSDVE